MKQSKVIYALGIKRDFLLDPHVRTGRNVADWGNWKVHAFLIVEKVLPASFCGETLTH